jgi:hypothetical protein
MATEKELTQAEAIKQTTEKMNEVANTIISRVIQAREAMMAAVQPLNEDMRKIRNGVESAKRELLAIEGLTDKMNGPIAKSAKALADRISDLEGRFSSLVDLSEDTLGIIGKRVTLIGGDLEMTAGAIDEDGLVVCYYEDANPLGNACIISTTVHHKALKLALEDQS